jgi:signal transduction histidine kinase
MKLAGALAVPLLALVVVTSLEVVQSAREARRVREQTVLAQSTVGPLSLLSVLEDERNAAAVYTMGAEDAVSLPVENNAQAREAVDAAISSFQAEINDRGGNIAVAYRPALDQLEELDALRNSVDAVPDDERGLENIEAVTATFDGYSAIMDSFFDANKRVALAIDDPDLRRAAELTDLSARQTDLLARLVRDLLLAAVGGDAPDGLKQASEIDSVSRLLSQLRTNEQLIRTKATGDFRPLADDLFADESVQLFPDIVESSVETGEVPLDDVLTHSAGEDPDTFGYTVFRQRATDALADTATDLEAEAAARQRWFGVTAGAAVVIAGVVMWLVSRSITKPLRSLTHQAKEMAEHRLPDAVLDILETPLGDDVAMPSIDPVRVNTRDEVADVADALNTVQDTALDLAVEQAVLRRNIADSFVNLGRRNQNLLGRQLDFITELETNEADPDTLANLFRLDHLATRMRRNAESLLVLAGIEPPRKWAAPVRLTDVIRAALGEVEDYQRVTVRGVEPATILGSAAADLAHLLAELIENALVFSPPDQTVDIRGRNRPDGYTLAIIDSGLGMPATDVNAANRRLAGAESFTIAPSKYLGHYVAGNLAARHNIHVHLDNSPGNGITATIDIPPTLLTTDEQLAPELTPPHGNRGALLPITGTGLSPVMAPPPGPEPDPLLWPASVTDWEAPPVHDPAPYVPPPELIPPPPVEVSRTQSGLVKRSPANGFSTTVGAGDPSGDLLDALSRHSANLQRGTGDGTGPRARTGLWGPQDDLVSRDRPPLAPRRTPPADLVPPAPALDPYGPVPGPAHPAPGPYDPTYGSGLPPAPGPYPPSEPPMHGPPPIPLGPDVPVWEPPPSTADRPPLMPRAPEPVAERPRLDPDAGGVTSSGLTRRVRGAQLPRNEPLLLHRSGADAGGGATGNSALVPERTPEQRRKADDVYGFLTSFTAGVRRGLQEQPAERRRNGER